MGEMWMGLAGVQQIVGKPFACRNVENVELLLVIFLSPYNHFKKE
jgi:hypothetical protein